MELKKVLEGIHDPRGWQGQDYRLWSILGLIWPTVSQICSVTRSSQRRVKGVWQEPQQEAAYLITSLIKDEASPKDLFKLNRKHWGIEIMTCLDQTAFVSSWPAR
jgi:hypothetical protein